MGEPKPGHIILHGHRLNKVGAFYFPSGHKSVTTASWWIEKMSDRDVWILYMREQSPIYYFNLKQALLQATRYTP